MEIGVSIGISATLTALAYPSIEGAIGRGFSAAGLSPDVFISLSSIGVYTEAGPLLSDLDIGNDIFKQGNLLVKAATRLISDQLSGALFAKTNFFILGAFAKYRSASPAFASVTGGVGHLDELSVSGTIARDRLRAALGGKRGDGQAAHHVISWALRGMDIVKRAARGGFNINGAMNGALIPESLHVRLHAEGWNKLIADRLRYLETNIAKNASDREVAAILVDEVSRIRSIINEAL